MGYFKCSDYIYREMNISYGILEKYKLLNRV